MSDPNQTPQWMNDPLVKDIPPKKLELLQQMFTEASARVQNTGPGKSQQQMLMALMPVLKKAKEAHLSFSPQEMQAAVSAIRKYSSPEELKQIDKIYPQK